MPGPAEIAVLAAVALVAGTVDAIAGGGGLLTVPALLAAGLPPHLAIATNKGQSVFGSFAATIRFGRAGLLDGRRAAVTFPAGVLGSLLGAAAVLLVPPATLRPVVLLALAATAIFVGLRPRASAPPRASGAAHEKNGLGRWPEVAEALACLENGFEAATHFYAFPREHWHRIRSTNGLERLHGEIKRRTNAVGAFPDRASALRLVTAVALQATAIWTDRRYLDMSLMKSKEVAVAKAA